MTWPRSYRFRHAGADATTLTAASPADLVSSYRAAALQGGQFATDEAFMTFLAERLSPAGGPPVRCDRAASFVQDLERIGYWERVMAHPVRE